MVQDNRQDSSIPVMAKSGSLEDSLFLIQVNLHFLAQPCSRVGLRQWRQQQQQQLPVIVANIFMGTIMRSPKRPLMRNFNSQVRRSSFFRLVIVCTGDTKSDTVLARLFGIFRILLGTANLACSASIAA